MKTIQALLYVLFLALYPATMSAVMAQDQNSTLDELVDSIPQNEKISQAFYSTRVIQSQSVEMLYKGNLDVRILHRFGQVNNGIKEFFGLDDASMRMGLDFGITDNLTIGVGRSSFRKEYDLLIKLRPVQQQVGKKNIPFSLVLVGGAMIRTVDEISLSGYKADAGDRLSYYGQLLIGRKFSNRFSLQLIQTLLHMNYVNDGIMDNTIYALGAGGRLKLTKRLAFTLDYNHNFSKATSYYQPLGIGLDIETGGHVFQLHFSNAVGMNERAYLADTTDDFWKGEIRFGFNLSRMFQTGRK